MRTYAQQRGLGTRLEARFTVCVAALLCGSLCLGALPVLATHFPWDQAHDTTDWADPTDPGPCTQPNCERCEGTKSPVFLLTGHLVWTEQDADIVGRPGLTVTRAYNSHDPHDGIFGRGWVAGCEPLALQVASTEAVTNDDGTTDIVSRNAVAIRARDGKRYLFKEDDSGAYVAPPGRDEQVAEMADGFLAVRLGDGSQQVFDKAGRLVEESIAGSPSISYAYDDGGRISQMVDGSQRALEFIYDKNGHVTEVRDGADQVWSYSYDGTGNLVAVVDPEGGKRTYEYEPYQPTGDGFTYQHLVRVRDETGILVTEVTYEGERVSSYSVGQNVYTYSYDPANNTVTKRDATNSRWTFVYNEAGKATVVTHPTGVQDTRVYDDEDRLVSFQDALGHEWKWSYDGQGRLTSETNPLGEKSRWEFEGKQPAPTRAISPGGRVTEATYDDSMNVTSVTDPGGGTTAIAWGEQGAPQAFTDPMGRTTEVLADEHGLPIRATTPAGRSTDVATDAAGRVVEVSNGAGDAVRYTRNALGWITAAANISGATVSMRYDAAGRPLEVVDPAGGKTAYSYDDFGRLAARTLPDGRTFSFTYRADNLIDTVLRPDGSQIRYTYDAGKRLTNVTAGSERLSFSYTARDELELASNRAGSITFTYDAAGRVAQEVSSLGTVAYAYNEEGEVASAAIFDAEYRFERNPRGQLTAMVAPEGRYQLQYDELGRRTGLSYPNGTETRYSYNALDQLSALEYTGPFSEKLEYSYDDLGRLTGVVAAGAEDWAYEYDVDGQLVAADADSSFAYAYDEAGNRTGEGRVYDSSNRLTADDHFSYVYDGLGNLITKQDLASGARTEFDWNGLSQLVTMREYADETSAAPTRTTTYMYGPLGRRWGRTVDGEQELYGYAGTDRVVTLDAAGTVTERATFGTQVDEPLALVDDGGERYLHADHLGSIIGISDTDRELGRYAYGPFGETLSAPENVKNPYRFTAREFERDDLYFYRARYYDPTQGRFLSEDPLGIGGGDTNLYRYASNNPVHLADPSGEFFVVLIPIIWAGAEILMSAYDAYDTIRTLLDPCVSAGEKWLAGGLFLAGAVLPGGGYSKLDDLARYLRRVPCACFAEGTLVATDRGLRPIEDIAPGDLVMAHDPESGETALKEVTAVQTRREQPLFELTVQGPDGQLDTLVTTPGHPFWSGTGWQPAASLQADAPLRGLSPSSMADSAAATRPLQLSQGRSLDSKGTVYNLQVEGFHTYFVGEAGTLVHNASECRLALGQLKGMRLSEAKQLMSRWDKATYRNIADSIRDHARRHGFGDDIAKYMRKAAQFNKSGARKTELADGAIRYTRKSGEFLIERGGKIVTYGFN